MMDIDHLINCVYSREGLWDQKHPQHHNRFILDKLWDEVATKMKSKPRVVRAKWKTLRDTYRKEYRKFTESQTANTESQWYSTWKYYDKLTFLNDQFSLKLKDETSQHEGNIKFKTSDESTSLLENDSSNIYECESTQVDHSSQSNLKRKQTNEDDATVLVEEDSSTLNRHYYNEIDEDASFFNSLLPHVRRLTPQNKMKLRMGIQELVYNFVYGN